MTTIQTEGSDREPAQYMEALTYKAPFLIDKLLKEQIVDTREEGEVLFAEAIRYFILNQVYPTKRWQMVSRRVDEVWHQFVLFTVEYFAFCKRYFGNYLHHAPGNSPSLDAVRGSEPSFQEFSTCYEAVFAAPLPEVWHDTTSVRLNRRVVHNDAIGELHLEVEDGTDMVTVCSDHGPVVSISCVAMPALEFVLQTKAFYVRELPGELTEDEKLGLVETFLNQRVLLVAA